MMIAGKSCESVVVKNSTYPPWKDGRENAFLFLFLFRRQSMCTVCVWQMPVDSKINREGKSRQNILMCKEDYFPKVLIFWEKYIILFPRKICSNFAFREKTDLPVSIRTQYFRRAHNFPKTSLKGGQTCEKTEKVKKDLHLFMGTRGSHFALILRRGKT